jgi:hypothetical protein
MTRSYEMPHRNLLLRSELRNVKYEFALMTWSYEINLLLRCGVTKCHIRIFFHVVWSYEMSYKNFAFTA